MSALPANPGARSRSLASLFLLAATPTTTAEAVLTLRSDSVCALLPTLAMPFPLTALFLPIITVKLANASAPSVSLGVRTKRVASLFPPAVLLTTTAELA